MSGEITLELLDVYYGQLAPSQQHRTHFVPGETGSSRTTGANSGWTIDFKVPQNGTRFNESVSGPVTMSRIRHVNLGTGIIS